MPISFREGITETTALAQTTNDKREMVDEYDLFCYCF